MQFHRNLRNIDATIPRAVTIGNFDGVHLGHQQLCRQLYQTAQAKQLTSTIVLFEPQPQEYFKPERAPARLTSLREKVEALSQFTPIEEVICLHFNEQLAQLTAESFVKNLLVQQLNCRYIFVGNDFRFARQREGSIDTLQKLGQTFDFQTAIIPDILTASGELGRRQTASHRSVHTVHEDDERRWQHPQIFRGEEYTQQRISSTLIRQLLELGKLQDAAKLLGRPYSITGKVMRGAQRGQQIGFPTANIALRQRKVPLSGVFAVTVSGEGLSAQGVANVGWRPTVDGKQHLLEVHLFNFSGQLYGQLITVHFHHKIRDEQRFSSLTELREQIAVDVTTAEQFFQEECTE